MPLPPTATAPRGAARADGAGPAAAGTSGDDPPGPAREPPPGSGIPRRAARALARLAASPRAVGWLAPVGVALFALLLRAWRLDEPAGVVFDEVYYARDAHDLLTAGVEVEDDGGGRFVVHPPLGKWLVAVGEAVAGTTRAQVLPVADGGTTGGEVGYRAAAVVAGALTVLVLARLARRMTGSTLLGCLAGLLLALDGLHLVQSRVAMLDVFLVGWLVAAVACLVTDRDAARARLAAAAARAGPPTTRGLGPRLGIRWWRVAAGVCVGAALATKWSAAWPAAVIGLLAVAWDLGARRAARQRPLATTLRRDLPGAFAALALLPVAVYTASWAGWFASDAGWARDAAAGRYAAAGPAGPALDALAGLVDYHRQVLEFHGGLSAEHTYSSQPAQWLPLSHPVVYAYTGLEPGDPGCTGAAAAAAGGCAREVLAVGTPALWWTGSLALVGVLALWLSRRDWRAAAVLALVGGVLLPWAVLPGRTMFLFYALPALPFLVLGLVLLAGTALGPPGGSRDRRTAAAVVTGAFVLVVAANTAYLWPVLTAEVLPLDAWRARQWFPTWVE